MVGPSNHPHRITKITSRNRCKLDERDQSLTLTRYPASKMQVYTEASENPTVHTKTRGQSEPRAISFHRTHVVTATLRGLRAPRVKSCGQQRTQHIEWVSCFGLSAIDKRSLWHLQDVGTISMTDALYGSQRSLRRNANICHISS